MKNLAAMFDVQKYDQVGGWFGFGTVTDIPEGDNTVIIRQGVGSHPAYRVILIEDIAQNFTAEDDITR